MFVLQNKLLENQASAQAWLQETMQALQPLLELPHQLILQVRQCRVCLVGMRVSSTQLWCCWGPAGAAHGSTTSADPAGALVLLYVEWRRGLTINQVVLLYVEWRCGLGGKRGKTGLIADGYARAVQQSPVSPMHV